MRNPLIILLCSLFFSSLIFSQNDSIAFTNVAYVGGKLTGSEVLGDHAFICEGTRMNVIDLTKTAFEKVAYIELNRMKGGIAIRGNHAFIAAEVLIIADISDPVNPLITSELPADFGQGVEVEVEVNDDFAFVLSRGNGLFIFDIADMNNPVLAGTFSNGNLLVGIGRTCILYRW